ncbi:hypothetical protein JKF63_02954 [Porcisia hertigi]|uniref:CRAL-TRIO domain-containing protein n=1 Tax=Porcisia hertigi TaxID=2761500 RepID=A0A836L688_9TRYP|nr:hypothetical protein JKF63_02954 [Porcisia hertigi]
MVVVTPTPKEIECAAALKAKYPATNADPADPGFLNDSTYLRFARARDGNIAKASEMLDATLTWRKKTKPYAITKEEVKKAMGQTTMVCGGRCNIGLPVVAMVLGMPNECTVEERTKQMVYIMEETQRKGYERITWIIDFRALGNNSDKRTKETRKETMKILQDHYPERMGRILLHRAPWYIRMLLGVAKKFMDSRTAAKIFNAGHTIEDLEKYIDRSQVPSICDGTMKGSAMSHLEELPSLNREEARNLGLKERAAEENDAHNADRVLPEDMEEVSSRR